MKRHRFLTFLPLLLILGFGDSALAQDVIEIQTEAWPPLVMQETSGKPSGHDYEVMDAVFKQLNQDYTLVFLPWKRVIKNMKEQSADAVLGIIPTAERKQFLFFPDEPISSGGYVIFHRKNDTFEYTGLESLSGKVVGVIGGFVYSEEFNSASNFIRQETVGEGALVSNFRKLLVNRIELVIANRNVGLFTASNLGIVNKIGYSQNYVSGESSFYLAFSQRDQNKALATSFSEALRTFKKTEAYRTILSKYGLQ